MDEPLTTALTMSCYTFVGLPFDVVKLRMQTQGRERAYKGVTDAMIRITREEGVCALGKGGVPRLANKLLFHPLTYAVSGVSKRAVTMLQLEKAAKEDEMTLAAVVETSVGALFTSTILTVPENIKCKLQFQRGQQDYRGPLDCARKVIDREGMKGLFRGCSSVLLRDVPAAGLFLGASTALEQVPFIGPKSVYIGLAASIASVGLLYPLDVVKAHIQTSPKPLTLREGFRLVFARNGFRGFYRGCTAAAMGETLSVAAMSILLYNNIESTTHTP